MAAFSLNFIKFDFSVINFINTITITNIRVIKVAQCDMCGKEEQLVDAIVEGSMLSLCSRCAKHGNIIPVVKNEEPVRQYVSKLVAEPEIEIAECAKQVKKAREKKGMTQKQLAVALAEKESVIHRIESGKIKPPVNIAKKLEQFLGIKIVEEFTPEPTEVKRVDLRDPGLTIGDLISLKK